MTKESSIPKPWLRPHARTRGPNGALRVGLVAVREVEDVVHELVEEARSEGVKEADGALSVGERVPGFAAARGPHEEPSLRELGEVHGKRARGRAEIPFEVTIRRASPMRENVQQDAPEGLLAEGGESRAIDLLRERGDEVATAVLVGDDIDEAMVGEKAQVVAKRPEREPASALQLAKVEPGLAADEIVEAASHLVLQDLLATHAPTSGG